MIGFDAIREHVIGQHTLKSNEPFVIGFDVLIADTGRLQGVFLAEIRGEKGGKFLRVSTPVAPLGGVGAERCLRFNWEQRVGFLAVTDLDGEPYIQLCENLRYDTMSVEDIDFVVRRIAPLADEIEQSITGQDQV